jgi:DUF1009 family protein
MEKLGIAAGSGKFPVIVAKEAKKQGVKTIVFAIKGISDPEIEKYADKIIWIEVEKFSIQKFILQLLMNRPNKMVLVGKFDKSFVLHRLAKHGDQHQDVKQMFDSTKDNKDYSLLDDITKRFAKIGIKVTDGKEYLSELLPEEGVLSERGPSDQEKKDIEFGFDMAKKCAELDIGQTITVHNKSIVTIEAIEGTDSTIKRAAEYVKEGFIVCKAARPQQDMRWDVPVIGLETIEAMIEAGATALVMEAGKMYFLEREQTLKKANEHNISIIAM